MANYRVQLVRTFTGAPAIGKWKAYTTFWFSGASGFDFSDAEVARMITRLADAQSPTATVSAHSVYGYTTGAGNARLLVYQLGGGGGLTFHQDVTFQYSGVPGPGSGTALRLPSQCMITVGFKAVDQAVRQRGRSRWFVGPVVMVGNTTLNGTIRISAGYVDDIANNAKASIQELATLGLALRVHSGKGAAQSLLDPVELYVDDVFDVQRSRRTWVLNQSRLSL